MRGQLMSGAQQKHIVSMSGAGEPLLRGIPR